ncbi:ComEC/Rec2 family competence protein [Pseudotenacibaculum sp. MALMAid0570]|uniref:ComEC/Rec2 family competence protein n=1 Tax=Pseudotenacibaculum sp. MALMAid0570 TaxID=3143938 RepID=UPI0032E04501
MKKLLGYLPFHFLLFLVVGICIQFYTDVWCYSKIWIWVIFLWIIVLQFLLKKTTVFKVLTWSFFLFLGIVITYHSDDRNQQNYFEKFLRKENTSVLKIKDILKPNNFSLRYTVEVIQVNENKTLGTVLLSIRKDTIQKALNIDDCILINSDFLKIKEPLNPHQFNYQNYLAKQGIYQQVFLNNQEFLFLKNHSSFLGSIARVRKKIQKAISNENFSQDELGVINALLLGQRQEVSKELLEEYSRAGAIHILAISGLHVGIILLILSSLCKPLEYIKHGKFLKLLFIVLLLWFFALLAGMSASVVRAVTMFTAVAIGQAIQKRNSIEYSLVFSMLILLTFKPLFLFDVGFQLSYIAVFGIITIQPKLSNLWKSKWKLVNKFWQLTTVSLAAQISVLPLSLFYFHQFPGLFLLSNLVIVPFLGIILMGGILIIILALCSILPETLVYVYGGIISLMNNFIRFVSDQETFLFSDIPFSFLMMIVAYLLIIFGFRFFEKRTAKRLLCMLSCVVLFQVILLYEKYESETQSELLVFHKNRHSVYGIRRGKGMVLYSSLDSLKRRSDRIIQAYRVGESLNLIEEFESTNFLNYKNHHVLLIDSLGIYQIEGLESPIVILQSSPKINLRRLLEDLKPRQIIADGSNYKSSISRWQQTCIETKTPFWFTGQNGVYILK